MEEDLSNRRKTLESQQFEFAIQQFLALRTELDERMARVHRLVYLLLSGALVYVTVIFLPLLDAKAANEKLPLWNAIMASAEDSPVLMMLICLTLFVPLLCFAIEAMITAETDGISRGGIFIRDNIEARIITSKSDGWENWLDLQDTSFGKRTSERLARSARFLIISLYCFLTAMIGGFAASHYYGPGGFVFTTPIILTFYVMVGFTVFRMLGRTQSSELVARFFDVVVIDLDGCLLNNAGQISDRNRAAIQELKRKNVIVLLATGRAASGTWPFLEELGLHGPHVVSNGSCLATWPEKYVETLSFLPTATLNKLCCRLTEEGIMWAGFSSENIFCMTQDKDALRDQLMGRSDISEDAVFYEIDEIGTWDWQGRAKISKLWCPVSTYDTKRNASLEKIALEIANDIASVRTTNDTFEFFCKGVNKVDGVEEILRRHNKQDKLTLALGDQNNDLELLIWADEAHAPSNASPQVRNELRIKKINKSNEEDFVAEVVQLLF